MLIPHLMFAHMLIAFMWTGAALIVVTRYYDITWWANWLDMISYMKRWRVLSYSERIAMLALAAGGFWVLTPLCALPRLAISYRRGHPIWRQRRGGLEMALGIALSTCGGSGCMWFTRKFESTAH